MVHVKKYTIRLDDDIEAEFPVDLSKADITAIEALTFANRLAVKNPGHDISIGLEVESS